MKSKKSILTTAFLIFFVTIFIAFLGTFITTLKYYLLPESFNSTEWVTSYERFENSDADGALTYQEFTERKKMVYSLIRSKELIGKNRDEVKEILGIDGNEYESTEWLYWIDFTAADNKWLEVKFDNSRKVNFVSVIED
jgi:hypothetical protein